MVDNAEILFNQIENKIDFKLMVDELIGYDLFRFERELKKHCQFEYPIYLKGVTNYVNGK